MTREGVFTLRHTTASNGSISNQTFRLPDMPILISVVDEAEAITQGGVYVALSLLANNDRLYQLCSGFVYAQKGISYPTASNIDSIPGRGLFREFAGTNPAAGDEIVETVPNGRLWHIIAIQFTLVAAVAAFSRRPHVFIIGSGGGEYDFFSSIDQITGETKTYTAAAVGAVPDETDANKIIIAIPNNLYLPENSMIRTRTTNIQAGDNYSAPNIMIEEFFQTPQ